MSQSATIRPAQPGDVPAIIELMHSYMGEAYGDSWHGSADALANHGFGQEFEIHVAAYGCDGELCGLIAWNRAYDLHHCLVGGEIIDMFVTPAVRGRSIGPLLVCAVAAEVHARGGLFLRGQAVKDRAVRRLYERVAVTATNMERALSGRAFRRLSKLAGGTAKDVARRLPDRTWNYEA